MTVAAGDALPFPVYAGRYRVVFPLLDADGDLVTGATTPDSELSQDQGTFADATNEMTEIATNSGVYYLDLISTETDCSCVTIIAKSATAGMKTTVLTLYPRRFPVLRSGTAQAGAGSTITLDSGASAVDDFYNGCLIQCSNNSPANVQGQTRFIIDYVGSTKVATVGAALGTNPSSATTFEIYVPENAGVNAINGAETSVTTAGLPNANVTQISDDATAANNAESFFDGTGYAGTGNVIPTVTTVNGLANNTITAAAIATGAIDADAIADNAIDAGAIAADAITAAKIADGAIDAATFAAGAITATVIADGAIDAAALAADTITAAKLAADVTTELQSGLATAAALATVDANVDTLLAGLIVASGTIGSTGNSTTALHLTGLTYGDDEINNYLIVIRDVSASEYHARWIEDWADTGDLATVATLPFTPENATDTYVILPVRQDVTGGSGLDAAGVRAAIGLASANLDTQLDALPTAAENADAVWDEDATAHQTQGTFGQAIGDPAADSDSIWALANTNLDATISSRASQTSVNTVDDFLDTEIAAIITTLGTPSNLGSGATIAANLVDIEGQTDDIGAAGAGLTAVPWNAAWDAEVQSEVDDALVAQNLDHLVKSAVDTNFATTVHLDSVIGQLADNGTTATFDRTTDSLEALQAEHDATQTAIDAVDNFVDTEIADIQSRLPAALVSGRMDSNMQAAANGVITAAVIATGAVDADAIAADAVTEIQSGLSTLTAAQVNAEVVDALATDTYAEPGQGAPAATATLAAKINYLYKAWRNKSTQTSTTYSLFADDASTVDQKATVSDDTTTFTKGEIATGP